MKQYGSVGNQITAGSKSMEEPMSTSQCQQLIYFLSSKLQNNFASETEQQPVVCSLDAICHSISHNNLILGSDATHHVWHDLNCFMSFDSKTTVCYVNLLDRGSAYVARIGSIQLNAYCVQIFCRSRI